MAGKCTDNATAVNAAIGACFATGFMGCTVFFPASGTANYYIGSSIFVNNQQGTPGLFQGVKMQGDCNVPGSRVLIGSTLQPFNCSTLVTNAAINMVVVGLTGAANNTFGFEIQDLGFFAADGTTALGAIELINTSYFNLTNIACSNFRNIAGTNGNGYCVLLNGDQETQYGVIVNPSISSTRFPIQTTGSGVSEINFYGGAIDCNNPTDPTKPLGSSIGIDIGSTSHPGNQNGEWGVFGTHIIDCATGVSMVDTNVMQWFGVMELATTITQTGGTVGFQIDSTALGNNKGGGNLIGGSINHYETGVKIGQVLTGAPLATRITASITNTATPLSISQASLPTTMILTPDGTIGPSQLGSDLTLFSQSAASPPTFRALLTTIQNESGTGTTASKLAKLTGAPSTAIITATSDTQGAVGIVVTGAGTFSTSQNAQIATVGQALCAFDNAAGTVAGDFVTISSAIQGDCHDYGPAYPPSGQVIGRVLTTNGTAGTYPVSLFGPGQVASAPQLRNSITLTDEFFSAGTGATTAKDVGELGWTVTGGTSTSKIAGISQHPGILQRSTGTTSLTITVTYLGTSSGTSAAPIAALSNVAWSSVFIFRQDPNSTNPNTKIGIRVGFADTVTSNPPTNGIWFENSSSTFAANWAGNVKSGAMSTQANGTVALDTNFHTFEIRNDGANNITFWIDGSQYGSTVTTTIPAGALQPFFQIINTEAAAKLLDIDAFQFALTVSR